MAKRTTAGFRKGQWVTLASDISIVREVDGQLEEKLLVAGTVGIHHPLDADASNPARPQDRMYRRVYKGDMDAAKPALGSQIVRELALQVFGYEDLTDEEVAQIAPAVGPLMTGFHLVDASGFQTVADIALPPTALVAVTSRAQIPTARLATMEPNWTPAV